jgi:hypothetical protein
MNEKKSYFISIEVIIRGHMIVYGIVVFQKSLYAGKTGVERVLRNVMPPHEYAFAVHQDSVHAAMDVFSFASCVLLKLEKKFRLWG